MRQVEEAVAWVVYKLTLPGGKVVGNVVCEQSEWDEKELARPGYHTLVRAGITSESEAEALARQSSGFAPVVPPHIRQQARAAAAEAKRVSSERLLPAR